MENTARHSGTESPSERQADRLLKLIRTGKLSSPTLRSFKREDWASALAQSGGEAAAEELYNSVMWFADEIEAIRSKIEALRIDRTPTAALIRELCGRCNYSYVHSEAVLRRAESDAAPDELPVSSGHVLFRSEAGDIGNADAWRTGSTDTLGAALRRVFAGVRPTRGPGFGAAEAAARAFGLFNALYVLEFYCDKVVWQGWRVAREGDAYRILPPEPDGFGRSSIAVDWRRDQEHGEWTITAAAGWREGRGFSERVAYRARVPSPTRPFATKVVFPGQGSIPTENVLRWQIEASDLQDVVRHPLPAFLPEAVTLGNLIDAALLIGSAGRVLTNELLALTPQRSMRRFAPEISTAAIAALLSDLEWRPVKIAAVIEFFTYRGRALDGVWSKPLIPSDRNRLIPILPAIVGPNLYRSAELWLAEAGGDDLQRERGAAFEVRARRELGKAVVENRMACEVAIARPWTIKINGARRDIDLAIRVGATVFVGEAKLKRFPAAPRENGRWIDELVKGARQAQLRATYLADHPVGAADATAFRDDPAKLTFHPFVVTSGSFGSGVDIDGVPVIDFDTLKEFFDPGFFGVSGELMPGSIIRPNRIVSFRDEHVDLATALRAYLAEPLRIRVVERAMVPLARRIGVHTRDGHEIHCCEPMVDHRRFTMKMADQLLADSSELWSSALANARERESS